MAGQIIHTAAKPVNGVASLQGILSNSTTNEFKFGYNGAPTQLTAFDSGGSQSEAATKSAAGSDSTATSCLDLLNQFGEASTDSGAVLTLDDAMARPVNLAPRVPSGGPPCEQ